CAHTRSSYDHERANTPTGATGARRGTVLRPLRGAARVCWPSSCLSLASRIVDKFYRNRSQHGIERLHQVLRLVRARTARGRTVGLLRPLLPPLLRRSLVRPAGFCP